MSEPKPRFMLRRLPLTLLLTGILALVLACLLGFADPRRSFVAWQGAWVFGASLSIGAIFVLLLATLLGSAWIVATRRIGEALSMLIPLWAVLGAPILLAAPVLYPWADEAHALRDAVLSQRLSFMNLPFFTGRGLFYLAVFFAMALLIRRGSLSGTPKADRLKTVAAPGLLLYALVTTFASFDWVMSLSGIWYSTIFGIYFFVGSVCGALGLWLLLTALLEKSGAFGAAVGVEQRHDLAKYLFVMAMFWGHVAFLQFLLILYAKLPEETVFYAVRSHFGWQWVTAALALGHVVVPFFLFMARGAKRNLPMGALFGAWMLLMHALDAWWMTAPSKFPAPHFGAPEILCYGGFALVALGAVLRLMARHPLLPENDPRFEASVKLRSEP